MLNMLLLYSYMLNINKQTYSVFKLFVRGTETVALLHVISLPMEAMMTIRQTMRKVSQNLPTSVACCDAFSSHRSTKCQDIQIQNWLREDAARFDEHAN